MVSGLFHEGACVVTAMASNIYVCNPDHLEVYKRVTAHWYHLYEL